MGEKGEWDFEEVEKLVDVSAEKITGSREKTTISLEFSRAVTTGRK